MRLLRIAALVVLALVCSGCRLDLVVDVAVDRNGAGTLGVAVAADEELLELASDAGADPLGDLAGAAGELGEGWRVRDATDGDGTRTVRLTGRFSDEEEFTRLSNDLVTALAADEVVLVEDLALALDEETVLVHATAGAQPTRAVRDYGLTPRRAVRLLRRTDAFGYEVRVRLPGEILESNGTTHGDGQRWVIAPGEQADVRVRSTRPGPPWVRAVIGAVAGGALAALLLWLLARRRRAREGPLPPAAA